MKSKTIKKTIAGIVITGSIVTGGFVIDKNNQNSKIKQMRTNLIEKSEQGNLTYNEYLRLIDEYNVEIKKSKDKGKKFKLKNINKNNTVIKEMNKKIIN